MTENELKKELVKLDKLQGDKQLDAEMKLLCLLNDAITLTPLMKRLLKARLQNRLAEYGYASLRGLSHRTVQDALGPYAGLRYRFATNTLTGNKQEEKVPEIIEEEDAFSADLNG